MFCTHCGNQRIASVCDTCRQDELAAATKAALEDGLNSSDSIFYHLLRAVLDASSDEMDTLHALLLNAKRWGCDIKYFGTGLRAGGIHNVIRMVAWDITVGLIIYLGADQEIVEARLDYTEFDVSDGKAVTPISDEYDRLLGSYDKPIGAAVEQVQAYMDNYGAPWREDRGPNPDIKQQEALEEKYFGKETK